MRKSLTVAMAALTFGGAVAASATPADARSRGYYNGYNGGYYGGDYHHHHSSTDAAIVAGVAGLAIGAALASSNRGYPSSGGYYRSGYAYDPYYGDRYYAQPRYVYRTCVNERWVWDPYIREDVLIRSRYRC